MGTLRHHLRERWTDVFEWVDYRPDPQMAWLATIPALLLLGWTFGSAIGLGIAVVIALLATVAVAALGLVCIASWVVANALLDVVYILKYNPKSKPTRNRTLTN